MEAPVARVSSPVRNSRHRDSAPVQPCDQPLGSTLVIVIELWKVDQVVEQANTHDDDDNEFTVFKHELRKINTGGSLMLIPFC